MKEMIKRIKSILTDIAPLSFKPKNKAQSMVEFAITLPLLILLLLVIVEYGFILNAYLSLLDSTRQAARVYSAENPFTTSPPDVDGKVTKVDDLTYYPKVAAMLEQTLNTNSYQILYDSSASSPDNILVSVIKADWDTSTDPDTFTITRYPQGYDFFAYNNTNGKVSKFNTEESIKDLMTTPVDAGILIVEVYYGYEGTLKIPEFFHNVLPTENDPFILYASSVMPLAAVKPPRATPTP